MTSRLTITTSILYLSLLCYQKDYGCVAWSSSLKSAIIYHRYCQQSSLLRTHAPPPRFPFARSPREEFTTLETREQVKEKLCDILKNIPSNRPTGSKETATILSLARQLEDSCPTSDDNVLTQLAGNWELVWTSVDPNSLERRNLSPLNWINPIENQSYSNNPNGSKEDLISGRSNPILPQSVQDTLEEWGILSTAQDSITNRMIRSSQSIDLKKGKVRNVVSFQSQNFLLLGGGGKIRGSIIVDVDFTPSNINKRRIDVRFQACQVRIPNSPLDVRIPLGPIGPGGWLETRFIDDTMRITRGHKGSIFILYRI